MDGDSGTSIKAGLVLGLILGVGVYNEKTIRFNACFSELFGIWGVGIPTVC